MAFLKYLTLGFDLGIPEIFDLGISSQTGFFLGGVFGTFFWVGFLAQHGPEPPSPILLSTIALTKDIVKQVNTVLFNFIWNSRKDQIKRLTLVSDYKDGGLRMPHTLY